MEIKNQVALVTGGASGLGAATVKMLHESGAKVMIADIDAKGLKALAHTLGDRIDYSQMDVVDSDQVQAGIEQTMDTFGNIHILVNCASTTCSMKTVAKDGPHDLDVFKKIIAVNLIGTFDTLRLAAFHMQKNRPNQNMERGVIINTASVAAYDGQIGGVCYAASKAGVVGMTLPAARELARSGIRICTIAPGLFNTPMMCFLPEKAKVSLAKQLLFPSRLGEPSE